MIARILLFLGIVFHLALGLLLFGIGLAAIVTDTASDLKMTMVPWFGTAHLAAWLIGLGAVGALLAGLRLFGKLSLVFIVWTAFVLVATVYGFFFGQYVFHGTSDLYPAGLWCLGALVALLGAWLGRVRPRRG